MDLFFKEPPLSCHFDNKFILKSNCFCSLFRYTMKSRELTQDRNKVSFKQERTLLNHSPLGLSHWFSTTANSSAQLFILTALGPSGSSCSSSHNRNKWLTHTYVQQNIKTEQNVVYWLVYSLHKDQELNSCLKEGSKNSAVTSNKSIFLTKLNTHHMVSGIFTQIL